MLEINDYVVFGSTGVCQIIKISRENFGGTNDREYYTLNPIFVNSSTIYVPTDNASVKMRKILTSDEIQNLIDNMPALSSEWIFDDQLRRNTFNEAIHSGDPSKLSQLIKAVNFRKAELLKVNKKLSFSDEESMKAAEKLLYHEFALVLNINPEQVEPMIASQLA